MANQRISGKLSAREISETVRSPDAENQFADDINGIYNNLWPLNCRALSPEEQEEATTAIARIANKLSRRWGPILATNNQYLASAAVSALIRTNSRTRGTPLLDRLEELVKVIVRLGKSVFALCLADVCVKSVCGDKKLKDGKSGKSCKRDKSSLQVLSAIQKTRVILLSFAKTLDPNEIDVNVIDTQALFELIGGLQRSGIFKLCDNRRSGKGEIGGSTKGQMNKSSKSTSSFSSTSKLKSNK